MCVTIKTNLPENLVYILLYLLGEEYIKACKHTGEPAILV